MSLDESFEQAKRNEEEYKTDFFEMSLDDLNLNKRIKNISFESKSYCLACHFSPCRCSIAKTRDTPWECEHC